MQSVPVWKILSKTVFNMGNNRHQYAKLQHVYKVYCPVSLKCPDEDLHLVTGCSTAASHCSSEGGGSNADLMVDCYVYVTNRAYS